MADYMLLFWAPTHVLSEAQTRSAEEARKSGERWGAWQKALTDAGHSVTGAQLEAEGRRVIGNEKAVVDGTWGGDHVMGGYFVVSASSLAEAVELAKGSPVLENGGTVEVRPVMAAGHE
jgi:hypothetical protein